MGAWIETSKGTWYVPLTLSHPVWVRGLKHYTFGEAIFSKESHPVWVRGLKPYFFIQQIQTIKSHPVWVRGLKHRPEYYKIEVKESHPVWVRGLKLFSVLADVGKASVAPRVGAWIETLS